MHGDGQKAPWLHSGPFGHLHNDVDCIGLRVGLLCQEHPANTGSNTYHHVGLYTIDCGASLRGICAGADVSMLMIGLLLR